MKIARFFSRAAALALLAGLPLAVSAQSPEPLHTRPPHVTIAHPIAVSKCTPNRNTYMATGYTPAYYPGGPYWGWPAVYPGYTYYQYPVQGEPTLAIDYHNDTTVVMKTVEFGLLARGDLIAEVRDVGTFSPGAEIRHEFGLNPSIFPLSTSVVKCVPLKIEFADGSVWKNPHLPRLNRHIYGKPH